MDFEYKMVIVTRKDLYLSPGKLAAQVAHAAVACAFESKKIKSKWFKKWMEEGGKKAVVKVETVDDFHHLNDKAKLLDIVSHIVNTANATVLPEPLPATTAIKRILPFHK